jgi:hypothetical protein
MAFDENKYKSIFESRYGSGSYESGLANARKMGQLKAQAGIAKQQFDSYVSEQKKAQKAAETKSKKKTYTDALTYFNDPSVKDSIKKDGAYKIANDIKNDPQKQADIKEQGYNLSDYLDAMYNAASDGQYRSQREYGQYTKDLTSSTKKDNAAKDKEYQDKYGMTYQDYYDTVQKPQQDAAKKTNKKKIELPAISSKKKQNTLWDDIKNPAKRAFEALNPFDNVSFSEALDKNFTDTANTKRSKPVKETTRALTRIGNMQTFGAVNEATKAVNNGTPFQEFQDRKGAGKVADTAYDLIGGASTVIPGGKFLDPLANAGARKILGTKAGQVLEGLAASRGIHAGTAISSALRGAGAMGTYGAIQQGIGEALNPNEATFGQRALNVGAQAAAGAVLDPALSSVGGTIANSKLGQTIMNMIRSKQQTAPAPSQELLGLPEPQLRLNAPQQTLPAPRAVEPTLDTFNRTGTMPNGLQNPIPSMPKPMSEAMTRNNFENQGLNFGLNTNRIKTRPLAPQESAQNPTYWQGRYGDFVKYVQDQGYNSDNLNHEAIQELWTHFAKYDEPFNIDQVVDLAYPKGYQAPEQQLQSGLDSFRQAEQKPLEMNPNQLPANQDLTIKDYLNQDPKIKQKIQDMYPPQRPEQPISRPATFDEMYQRMQETAPPKQQATPLEPLQFRREKGFNPDLVPKIKNRTVEQPLNEKKSSLLLPLKPVNLKSVKTNKSVHMMNKAELQGVYKELQAKKTALSSTSTTLNAKAIKNVESDMKQVEGLLMKLDLQLFGEKAPKTVPPKLKAGADAAKTENISPAPKVKDPKQEYAIAQSKQKKLVEKYKANGNKQKEELAQLVKNSDQWKDKASPLLKRETMSRNFEDIMGKDAKKVKEVIIDPVGVEETKNVKFKNESRGIIGEYKIKGNTKDSALAQKYGERKITLEELKKETTNWKDVVKLSERLRGFYNEVLPKANKVLAENGFPPIPERKDYFPHAEDLTAMQKFLKKHVGIDFEDHTLPTDINGLTGNFKPGKQFFRNALQRKGDQTNYDAIANFDRYIEGIGNVIYHTPNIKRLRAFEQVLREKHTDTKQLSNFVSELEQYTNMLAGKKVGFDHMTEKYTTRKVYTFVDNIRKRTASNMLAYNVSSAITNTIPAFTQAPALIGKKYYLKGMLDTISNVVKRDGFETDFLVRRNGSDPLYRDFWDNVTEKGFWMMKTVDKFASQTIVRSKYYELIDKGIAEKEAKKQADDFASKIMADRSKGQMPTLFADKTLSMLTQFQLEVNNQVSFLFKDIPRMSKDKKAMASAYAQVFLYSYLYNNLYEKFTGRRAAFDPVGVVKKAIGDYNNDNISKGEATWRTVENVGNQLPFVSIATGGRYPIEAGIPNVKDLAQGKTTLSKEAAKPLTYLVPPTGGGQAKKVYQAATDFGLNPFSKRPISGAYRTDAKGNKHLQYPIDNNPSKAAQEALFGRSSLSETNDFFDNRRKELSPKQTRLIEESSNPQADFQALTVQRRMKTIQNEIKAVGKDTSLTPTEKDKKRLKLAQELTKLREGK